MSFTHTMTTAWSNGSRTIEASKQYSGDGQLASRDVDVPDSSTDWLVNWTCDFSQLQAIFILCDKAIIIETNDGSSPGDTLTLAANVPFEWRKDDSVHDNPFTVDVTALYVTTGSVGIARLQIEGLTDSTP